MLSPMGMQDVLFYVPLIRRKPVKRYQYKMVQVGSPLEEKEQGVLQKTDSLFRIMSNILLSLSSKENCVKNGGFCSLVLLGIVTMVTFHRHECHDKIKGSLTSVHCLLLNVKLYIIE